MSGKRGGAWRPEPIERDGTLLFPVPAGGGIRPDAYTEQELAEMRRKVSFWAMATRWQHLRSLPSMVYGFRRRARVGEAAPDFELPLVGGGRLRLSELRGRIAAFMFVAMTCPPAREQIRRWSELRRRYAEEDVALFAIYSRERHPGEPGYRDFHHTRTDDEKRAYAAVLAAETDLPLAVDGADEAVLRRYADVPNHAFVLDRRGTIVFKSLWSDHAKVAAVIDALLAHERHRPTA